MKIRTFNKKYIVNTLAFRMMGNAYYIFLIIKELKREFPETYEDVKPFLRLCIEKDQKHFVRQSTSVSGRESKWSKYH